ncbi:caspase family protein [Aureispira sp. CCB-QB1]|uniref:caspase family protein n=1 Tax=Aureispira sp. CCB-QB1 TaxID=1313421 RepID=UPI000698D6B4|nr:caspase family protein [Aureispira sp. CCB-QB1]
MKINILILFIFCLNFSLFAKDIRDIHYIKIMDSNNEAFLLASEAIEKKFDRQVKEISIMLGIVDIKEHNLMGNNFTEDQINHVIDDELKYSKGDIIIVVYLGHGYRENWQREDSYPILFLGKGVNTFRYSDLLDDILSNKPSVVISILNTCNALIPGYQNHPQIAGEPDGSIGSKMKFYDGHKDLNNSSLFWQILLAPLKQEKHKPYITKCIDFISSAPNSYANIDKNGGIFFKYLAETIDNYLYSYKENYTWESMKSEVESVTKKQISYAIRMDPERIKKQVPVCRITTKRQTTATIYSEKISYKEERNEQRKDIRVLKKERRKKYHFDLKSLKEKKVNHLKNPAYYNTTLKEIRQYFRVQKKQLRVNFIDDMKRFGEIIKY